MRLLLERIGKGKLNRSVVYFFVIFFCLFLTVLLPFVLPVQSSEQKAAKVAENNARSSSISSMDIFSNNYKVALLGLVPLFGWSFLLAVMWNTGLVVASYSCPGWVWLVFAVVEVGVYSFVVLQSIGCVQAVLKRNWRLMARRVVFAVFVSCAVLGVAAFIENLLIH
jgi:hypothetical protein